MDLLRPNAADRVEKKQQQQKAQHDRRAKPRVFGVGDAVFVRNSGAGCRWLPGQTVEKTGTVSFRVLLEDGRGKRCHQDQLRARVVDERGPDSPPGDLSSSTPVPGPSFSDDVPPITVLGVTVLGSVCVCVCVSVKSHLTSRMSNRAIKEHAYLVAYEC